MNQNNTNTVSALEDRHEHDIPMSRYVIVWLALLALTGLTVGMDFVDTGRFHLVVALGIASFKAGLVALFFMHLWDQEGTNRLILVVSTLFVVFLLMGALSDGSTRWKAAMPDGSSRNPVEKFDPARFPDTAPPAAPSLGH